MCLDDSTRAPGRNGFPSVTSLLTELLDPSAIAGNSESAGLGQLSRHSLEGFAPGHNISSTLLSACTLGLIAFI